MKESRSNSSRRRISGQSLIKYKGLELVMCFLCLRNNKKTREINEGRLTDIINLLNELQEGSSDNLNADDINELLIDHELIGNELIH